MTEYILQLVNCQAPLQLNVGLKQSFGDKLIKEIKVYLAGFELKTRDLVGF